MPPSPLPFQRAILTSFPLLAAVAACSAGKGDPGPSLGSGGTQSASGGTGATAAGGSSANGGTSATGGGGSGGSGATGGGITVCQGDECPNPVEKGICGDAVLTEDEACDDGNVADGDGCAASCLSVEPGHSCSPPGVPCHAVALCADSVVNSNEMCDDGNSVDGDGCSARCKLELGYRCDGSPSECTATTCGDGEPEGAESCDDGNTVPLDGCSETCQAEPECTEGACTSDCGDGLIIDEECDDANTLDGDGCSSTCKREPGFDCVQKPACVQVGDACALRIPVVFRDFSAAHADFHCGGGSARPTLATELDAEGKPVLLVTPRRPPSGRRLGLRRCRGYAS
jgi:cysteine-rich repeat protein